MRTWKVSHRLLAAFGLIILLLLGVAVYSLYVTRSIDLALSANATQNVRIQRAAINFRGSAHDRSIAVRDVVLAPTEKERDAEIQAIQRLAAFYAEAGQQLDKTLADNAGSVPLEVRAMAQAIHEVEQRAVASTAQVVQLVQAGDRQAAEALLWRQAKPQYVEWLAAINRLIDFEEQRIIANTEYANHAASQFAVVLSVITVLAVLIGAAAIVWVSRSITHELGAEPNHVRAVVQALQEGNLVVAVATKPGDESSVIAAVREMRARFHNLVAKVRSSVIRLRDTSGEISRSNQELAERTELAIQSLRQTTQSIDQLATLVQHNEQSAHQARDLVSAAAAAASDGGEVMQRAVRTMQEIHKSSQQIADIIGVIDGIAFQTNILALNAAVEAARAGEQGRGFAVVAAEVRRLAQRSAEAAKEITSLIQSSVEKIDSGSKFVADAGARMEQIVAGVKKAAEIIAETSASAVEQSQGIAQVNGAITQLEQMTEQNGEMARKSREIVQKLQEQAEELARLVEAFRVEDDPSMRTAALVQGPRDWRAQNRPQLR